MQEVNRPLVVLCIAAFLGIYSFQVFKVSIFSAALLVALFFLLIYVYKGKEILIIAMAIFFIAYMNTVFYYSIKEDSSILNIKITKIYAYRTEGQFKGRKIIINSEKKLTEGYEYIIKGSFTKEINIENGTVGTVKINTILNEKQTLMANINKYNDYIYDRFKNVLGDKEAGVICSVAFGNTKGIDKAEKDTLNEYGIVHIISVSGFHMSLIYLVLERLFGFYISTIIALIYVIFTGAQPAMIRAFLMILLLKVGKGMRKNYDSISSLSLSAIILILYKPYNAYDLGFILSYTSTLSILLFYKRTTNKLYKLPNIIRDSTSLTLSAQILSFPIVSLTLKNVSLNFIWGNLILIPFFTFIVELGNLAIVFLKITPIFNFICRILHFNLMAVQGGINVLDLIALPFLKSTKAIVYSYCVLAMGIYFYKKGYHKLKFLPIPLLLYVLISNYSFQARVIFIKEKYTKYILVEDGFYKTLISKKDSYKGNIKFEYNAEKSLDGPGAIKLNKRILLYDNKLDKIYIKQGDNYIRINWSDKVMKNHDYYDIINLDSEGGTLVLTDKISLKSN